jgi:uncharacterized protein
MTALYVALGIVFGLALSRSGAADYDFIQGMFLLTNLQLYGIIGSAVAFTAPLLYLLKRYGRTVTGAPITIELKGLNRGTIVGGALFGVGWSITGMCPGPILVNVGEGKLYALAALAGALLGASLLSVGYAKLAGPFGLPPLRVSTSEG